MEPTRDTPRDNPRDMLERVVAELNKPDRVMTKVAEHSGVKYDTVLRVRNREGDPGYSIVKLLSDYLFGSAAV